MTRAEAAIPRENSAARRGSSASVTRIEAELANAARESRKMQRFSALARLGALPLAFAIHEGARPGRSIERIQPHQQRGGTARIAGPRQKVVEDAAEVEPLREVEAQQGVFEVAPDHALRVELRGHRRALRVVAGAC